MSSTPSRQSLLRASRWRPGQTVQATVSVANSVYTMTIRNLSNGTHFSTSRSYRADKRVRAEWLAEDPFNGEPSVDYRKVSFVRCSATLSSGQTVPIGSSAWSYLV